MKYKYREDIFNRLEKDFDTVEAIGKNQGFTCIGVFLRGSQNYNLDDKQSDIDSLAIVLSNLNNLIDGYKASIEHHNLDDSHVDIKDIRYFFNSLKKQNPSYLEMLSTNYCVFSPDWEDMWFNFWSSNCPTSEWGVLSNQEAMCRYHPYRALQSIYGDMKTKYKNLFHDAPHSHEDIEKYGYCLKDFHHLYRMKNILVKYISYILQGRVEPEQRIDYKDLILVPKEDNNYYTLMNFKRQGYNLQAIHTIADTIMKQYGNIVEQTLENWESQEIFYKPNEFLEERINRFAKDCIRLNIEYEILGYKDGNSNEQN